MEYVFTIKVKTNPDQRNVFPSERRYSASTVAGLAWIHIILAAISFVLACLAIVRPVGGGMVTHLSTENAITTTVNTTDIIENVAADSENLHENITINNSTNNNQLSANEYSYILVLAPSILTIASLAAGSASIMASRHWYIDRNITWLFLMSILSSAVSVVSFVTVLAWVINVDRAVLSQFYTESEPFQEFIVIPKDSIMQGNISHIIIGNYSSMRVTREHLITKRVLSVNILIACFIELVWSLLSLKISYKGMKNEYREDESDRRPDCVKTVTVVKGNKNVSSKHSPDLIENHPKANIAIVLNGPDHDRNIKKQNEYEDRITSYLNSSFESDSKKESLPSIPPIVGENPLPDKQSRVSTMSWGDARDNTIYNQNNLDLEKIIKEKITSSIETEGENKIDEAQTSENCAD